MQNIPFKKILVLLIVFSLCINALFLVSAHTTDEEDSIPLIQPTTSDLDNILLDYMDKAHLPSLSIAIIKNKSIAWTQCYGYSDITTRTQPTNKTIYMLASISKTFTATALMQLWEQGLFDLDDDINDYLPSPIRNPNYPDIPITFRMLLTHQSSLSSRNVNLFTIFSILQYPYEAISDYLTPGGKFYSPLNWKDSAPGEDQVYSSTGFELLGFLIECISNQSYTDYCTQHILLPLEMHNSSYHPADCTDAQLARQYMYLLGFYIRLPNFEDRNYASGGLRSNLEDLSHYLIAFMNKGEYNGVRILENETIDLMFSLQSAHMNRYPGYGLGWQIFWDRNGDADISKVGHNGGMVGSITYMFYHIPEDVGVIILSNQHTVYKMGELLNWFSLIQVVSDFAEGPFL